MWKLIKKTQEKPEKPKVQNGLTPTVRRLLRKPPAPTPDTTARSEEANKLKRAFLYYYGDSECQTVRQATDKIGVPRTRVYDWVDQDNTFKEQYMKIRQTKPPAPMPVSWKLPEDLALKRAGAPDILTEKEKENFLLVYRDCLFNITKACETAGLDRGKVVAWLQTDEEFKQRLQQIDDEKKDFIEGALMHKIVQGDIAAIIFATKCLLKERGYIESAQTIHAQVELVRSKEEIDAIVRAAQLSSPQILDVPGVRLLEEHIQECKDGV